MIPFEVAKRRVMGSASGSWGRASFMSFSPSVRKKLPAALDGLD